MSPKEYMSIFGSISDDTTHLMCNPKFNEEQEKYIKILLKDIENMPREALDMISSWDRMHLYIDLFEIQSLINRLIKKREQENILNATQELRGIVDMQRIVSMQQNMS